MRDNRDEAFLKEGFSVVVYTPVPTRGVSEDVRREYCKPEHRVEMMYGGKLAVLRFAMYREGKNPVLRALRYALCWVRQLYYGLREKDVDCVYLASTPPIQGMLGSFIKMFRGIPFVYNLQDIFPDSLVNNGLARKGGLLWKAGRVIEDFTYKHADRIIVISEDFKRNIMAKGVPEEKITVIYNWVDENAVVDIPRGGNKLFDRYGLDRSKFYVTYCGNIGLSQNMDMLLDVAEEFRGALPDIRFVLVGNGAYLDEVKRMVAERGLDNVRLLPFQPYGDISHVFSLGDVSLVISKPGTGSASVPSKTWSIMSASRPVLANFDENGLKDIVEGNNCGIFTRAGDRAAFADAILRLYNDRELCRRLGANGRRFVMERLTREAGTRKYVQVIKDVAGGPRRKG